MPPPLNARESVCRSAFWKTAAAASEARLGDLPTVRPAAAVAGAEGLGSPVRGMTLLKTSLAEDESRGVAAVKGTRRHVEQHASY